MVHYKFDRISSNWYPTKRLFGWIKVLSPSQQISERIVYDSKMFQAKSVVYTHAVIYSEKKSLKNILSLSGDGAISLSYC